MVTKRPKGLGRGLEALLGPTFDENAAAAKAAEMANPGTPSTLMLTDMVAGQYQPRTRMDEGALYELAESIKAQGIMQPILVRRLTSGENKDKYEIIAGERRFRASKLAGLDSVPVLVREAAEQGKTLDAHFAHLVVHGMLHLQGYEHDDDSDAQVMEKAETDILRSLGYADPYA